ncbi:MAG: hypothetical protein HYR90_01880 [Candidatus Andersenbacteria bacterium]|nr:hypothetical protein [Candidatus Andersenbacteria bacterium]MBI3250910.1 hypothetical protein [Candidatus Andersenbacteria bacterium]
MNQRIIVASLVAAIVVVAIAIAAGWYFINPKEASAPTESTPQPTPPIDVENTVFTGPAAGLLSLGEDIMCTFQDAGTEGTVYITGQGKQMRGDFVTQVNSTATNVSLIRDNQYTYIWSDTESQGIKMAVTQEQAIGAAPQDDTNQNAMLDKAYTYDCNKWTVDMTKFTPPAGKNFVDLAQQQVPQLDCAKCKTLKGAAKKQCLQALSCK